MEFISGFLGKFSSASSASPEVREPVASEVGQEDQEELSHMELLQLKPRELSPQQLAQLRKGSKSAVSNAEIQGKLQGKDVTRSPAIEVAVHPGVESARLHEELKATRGAKRNKPEWDVSIDDSDVRGSRK